MTMPDPRPVSADTDSAPRSTRRALVFSFIDRYAGLVISVAASMAIARLLQPQEIGVFSVAMALLMLANTVRDVGAGQFVIQAKELTTDHLRAVWALQLGVGVLLGVLVAALAHPLARFYDEPRLKDILWVMAAAYFINPFGSITYAMLMRDMRFEHVALMRFAASASGATLSITLAMGGHGPISLAWGSLASTVANALTALWFRPQGLPWMPGTRALREVIGFGGRMTGTSVTNALVAGSPDFLLGKLQGMVAAGYYSRSNGLVAMFSRLVTDAVYTVATSFFAQQRREAVSVVPGFLRAMSYIAVLQMSYAVAVMLLAHPLTRLLYGMQWDDTVPLTRWLAAAAAVASPVPMCVALCTATGRADLALRATLSSGLAMLTAVLLGASVDLITMGMAVTLAAGLGAFAWLNSARAALERKLRWRELMSVLGRSGAVAVLAGAGPLMTVLVMGLKPATSWPPALMGLASASAGLVAGLFLFRHPLADEVRRLSAGTLSRWRAHQQAAGWRPRA